MLFCFVTRNVSSSTRVYSCNRILYIVLQSSLSVLCRSKQVCVCFFASFLLFSVLNFVHSARFSRPVCRGTPSLARSRVDSVGCVVSFVLLGIEMLTAYLKKRIKRCASKCLYVRSCIRTTVFWMLLVYNKNFNSVLKHRRNKIHAYYLYRAHKKTKPSNRYNKACFLRFSRVNACLFQSLLSKVGHLWRVAIPPNTCNS